MNLERLCVLALVIGCGACSQPAQRTVADVTAEHGARTATEDSSQKPGHVVAGRVPAATGALPPIVILEPRHDLPLPPPARVPYMDQAARTFLPEVLFVRTGHPAEFRNSDEEMHNVNVMDLDSRKQIFNVAVPFGERYVHHFEAPGIFYVSCDVHPGMSAQLVVTTGPYATFASADGQFEFREVVPGPYTLVVYAGSQTLERPVEVTGALTTVDVSAP